MSVRGVLIVSIFTAFLLASAAFAQDFTINKFHSDITINGDSSFIVKESIEVEFHRPKHGIYREIPYKYVNELGKKHQTPLDVMSVTDEAGNKWKYKVSKAGNVVNVRIGDADKYVNGARTYVILYKVDNALLFFDDHDELYWNVTGNFWRAAIKQVTANVTLPMGGGESKDLWASCYTGISGSRESQCGYSTSLNNGEFFTKKHLGEGEGFTIAFGWDKGLVSPPSALKRFLWAANPGENWVFIIPVVSLIFMVNLWYRTGRDPKVRESVTVMYEPPKFSGVPLTPAEVGILIDEKLDSRDITSSIVGLAVKGYIKIEEIKREGLIFDSTDYYLSKVKDSDNNLGPFEKVLMKSIFPGPATGINVSDMNNKFYKNLDVLKTTVNGELVNKKYFLKSPDKIRNYYVAAAIVVAVLVTIFCGVVFALFIPYSGPKNFLAGILSGLPVLAFAKAMPAKTKTGASAYMDILGFQEFMGRAEKDRIERMGDKDLFSRFLPYAIALDVVDNWARAFEGIYQNPPEWYVSPGGFRTFSPHRFGGSINSMTSSLGAAIFSAPRGSGVSGSGGFSGGGSSGGGFGGGGGGSW